MAQAIRSSQDIRREVVVVNIDSGNIDVAVRNGRAALFGTVNNYMLYRAAEEIAFYTQGVIAVDNKLKISR